MLTQRSVGTNDRTESEQYFRGMPRALRASNALSWSPKQ